MRLKIRDSHLASKVADKCLNVRERLEVAEWNKRCSPSFLCCSVNRVREKKPDRKKTAVIFPYPLIIPCMHQLLHLYHASIVFEISYTRHLFPELLDSSTLRVH